MRTGGLGLNSSASKESVGCSRLEGGRFIFIDDVGYSGNDVVWSQHTWDGVRFSACERRTSEQELDRFRNTDEFWKL